MVVVRAIRLTLVLLAVSAAGCGGYVGRAKRAYNDGRYLEAVEKLSVHEQDLDNLDPNKQADYGIYRGMSLIMLGDFANAHRWLSYAVEVERVNPGTLTPNQKTLLSRGMEQIARTANAPRLSLPPGAVLVPAGGRAVEPKASTPTPAEPVSP